MLDFDTAVHLSSHELLESLSNYKPLVFIQHFFGVSKIKIEVLHHRHSKIPFEEVRNDYRTLEQ